MMAVRRAIRFQEPPDKPADDPAVRLYAAAIASDQGDKAMKSSTALAVVLPSLVIASCISGEGPASHSRAEFGTRPEENRAAITALVAAHNDYLTQMRNSGGSTLPSSLNCN
jgi:hypothetical protein